MAQALSATGVSDDVGLLVLAALQGEQELHELLEGTASETTTGSAGQPHSVPEPARAYLSAIEVEGFRGIGPLARLDLPVGPGLTVISGRNGCGKSSFAEALEVALTSNSYRWKNRTAAVWKEAWRNVHQPETARITVELAVQDQPLTTVGAEWDKDATLQDVRTWTQVHGQKRQAGLSGLGWAGALEAHRPLLSYDELSSLVAEPSKLYKALAPILGLEQITDAQARLKQALGKLRVHREAANDQRAALAPLLRAAKDERGQQAFELIHQRRPDLDAVAALVTGSQDHGYVETISVLAQLNTISRPNAGLLHGMIDLYRESRQELVDAQGFFEASAARRSQLLSLALEHHDQGGDTVCPVCEGAVLDSAWAERTRAELDQERALGKRLSRARAAAAHAEQALLALITPLPRVLLELPGLGADVAAACQAVREAWQDWAGLTEVDQIAEHGPAACERLDAAVSELGAVANAALEARHDAWQTLALRLGRWHADMSAAVALEEQARLVDVAHTWVKEQAQTLRAQRMKPLSERTRAIRSALRHESNVDITEVVLQPWGSSGRVHFPAAVDGEEAAALAVMSQGEANALALSVFLPKATLADSPFGFLMIDDPVQAMDPAKVDGLARVLHEAARERQVIVLTHDDRLAEAVGRLGLPATMLQVTRDLRSVVSVRETADEARNLLADALTVARDPGMDDTVRRHVLPTLVRGSIESRCHSMYFNRMLRAGVPRVEVDAGWSRAQTTKSKVALALSSGDAGIWKRARPHRNRALDICARGHHQGLSGDPLTAVDDLRDTLADLEAHRG
ncbi:hypothetical protein Kisp01_67420 [Kineosporia sp. NBRC 101677]|nr:hypothetical protein Kisp01_67420 [Kineosporia sp. NBRC 101677]